MHDTGVRHHDLHRRNVFVKGRKATVIDYGRAQDKKRSLSPREREKDINKILKGTKRQERKAFRDAFVRSYGTY